MKTVAFFSYKGGTGKSMATANMAVCLSRMGKNVAVLDGDFGAPALAYKFGSRGMAATGRGGMIAYLSRYVQTTQRAASPLHFLPQDSDENPLQPFVGTVQPVRSRAGAVHLISAGEIHQEEYWEFLERDTLINLFSLGARSPGFVTDEDAAEYFRFLLSLKYQISTLEPRPEYLLVDLRNGIAEVSSFFIQFWADAVACLFSCNRENVDSYRFILDRLRQLERTDLNSPLKLLNEEHLLRQVPTQPLDVVPVLTRTPKDQQEHKGVRVRHTILQQLDLADSDLQIIHSDRNVEMWEKLQFGFHDAPANTQLTHEYIKLFGRLTAGPSKEQIEAKTLEFRRGLDLPNKVEKEERVFVIERQTGSMVNPSDESRNVAFKVTTFNFLLDELRNGLLNSLTKLSGVRHKEINKAFDDALRHAGSECGKQFGEDLMSVWGADGMIQMTETEMVKQWALFDSDVGFGRLTFVEETADRGMDLAGSIHVHETFLTNINESKSILAPHPHGRCAFMCGYIEGVLGAVLRRHYAVEHTPAGDKPDSDECESCEFSFRLAEKELQRTASAANKPIPTSPR